MTVAEFHVCQIKLFSLFWVIAHNALKLKVSTRLHGVTQGSIFEQLPFNIDLVNLSYECEESDIASYADDETPYFSGTETP